MKARLAEISERMKGEDAVFIVGVPRSGTTALRHTLDQHPSFAAGKDQSPETRIFAAPESALAILTAEDDRLLRYMQGDRARARELVALLEKELPARGLLARFAQRDAAPGAAAGAWIAAHRHDVVRAFFAFAKAARQSRRLLEKTPKHLMFLDDVFAAFPRARAIACTRHPVDTYSSYRKRLTAAESRGQLLGKRHWLRATPAEFAAQYSDWSAAIERQAAARPEAVRVLRYEDLTAAPERELQGLCQFLGEPFDRALLQDAGAANAAGGGPAPRGRIVANRRDWREYVAEAEAAEIERLLDGALRAFGYARAT